ncbi:hypothetical protein JCM11641_000953 [Rhodosporidiobolus odoratus]
MRTSFIPSLAVLAVVTSELVSAERTFTVKNNCAFPIWPAIFTSAGTAPAHPTGWEAAAGSSVSFEVAENWNGRLWGRTDCYFDGSGLPNTCSTGSCNGGLECATVGGTGVPPATLGEWNLNDSHDWYDVSLVDGFNLPMAITNNVGCNEPSCPTNINKDCPAALSVDNSDGEIVGCLTSCAANLDGNQADSGNCCSGSHDTPATCPKDKVEYYDTFKTACPDAYAYAYDESSGSALWTCDHSKGADYTVIFCP